MKNIRIFRTNVQTNIQAKNVIAHLMLFYPRYRVNFDLNDEEKILRIETSEPEIEIKGVVKNVINMGYFCEIIE